MKSVLFLIPTLDRGGAENVLVNLVNGMDQSKFKITVQTLFDKDSQKDRLAPGIRYKTFLYKQFRGNSRLMARLPARLLYRLIVREKYDIVVSYLEGPTTHILTGCPYRETKKVAWVHIQMDTPRQFSVGFASREAALRGYRSYDKIIFVARSVKNSFEAIAGESFDRSCVLYNTLDSEGIRSKASDQVTDLSFEADTFIIISVGRLIPAKGYDMLARVHKKLIRCGYRCMTYILGEGIERERIERYLAENDLLDSFSFLGFKENPYKYVAKADLFVCSSRREGFSTAVSEALALGVPVVSTNCSGAYELLGEDEYGLITENNEDSLYLGIKRLMDDPVLLAHYREKARERGKAFSTQSTVKSVENMLLECAGESF